MAFHEIWSGTQSNVVGVLQAQAVVPVTKYATIDCRSRLCKNREEITLDPLLADYIKPFPTSTHSYFLSLFSSVSTLGY